MVVIPPSTRVSLGLPVDSLLHRGYSLTQVTLKINVKAEWNNRASS